MGLLQEQADPEAVLFAAITLRGKVGSPIRGRFSRLTSPDYLRPPNTGPSRRARRPPKPDPSTAPAVCERTQAYPSTAMRLPGNPGHPNEGLERCPLFGRRGPQRRRGQPRRHPRLFASATRRGHRRSQNHLVCMWNTESSAEAPSESTWSRAIGVSRSIV